MPKTTNDLHLTLSGTVTEQEEKASMSDYKFIKKRLHPDYGLYKYANPVFFHSLLQAVKNAESFDIYLHSRSHAHDIRKGTDLFFNFRVSINGWDRDITYCQWKCSLEDITAESRRERTRPSDINRLGTVSFPLRLDASTEPHKKDFDG